MNTSNAVTQIREAARSVQASKQALNASTTAFTLAVTEAAKDPNVMASLMLSMLLGEDPAAAVNVSTPTNGETAVTAPVISNVGRNATVAREDPGTLPVRLAFILADAGVGNSLTVDQVIEQLKVRGWKPKSKDLRKYIGVMLPHLSAEKSKAGKDIAILRDNGSYTINPDAVISMGRKGNRVTVTVKDLLKGASMPNAAAVAEARAEATASAPAEPKRKIDVKGRALKALKGMRKPVSFTDITTAAKVESKSFQMIGMGFIRTGLLKKTRKTDEAGRKLFEVVHPKVNAAIKKVAAS
jgi:hypothetical protein